VPSTDPHPGDRLRAPRPPGTLRMGRIAGADVLVGSSWLVVAALVSVVLAPRVERVEPGLGGWTYLAGAAFAFLLCLSVLLHEAAHALVARRYGHRVLSIRLHFLSGVTAVDGEPRRPGEEFWIAVVGPLTSLVVGGVGLLAWSALPEGVLRLAVGGLAGANLLVGLLDLVPGLPLDGGRVLRAAVWRVSGSVHAGTTVAGWSGRVLAVLVLAWPLVLSEVLDVSPVLVDYLLVLVVGGFLWTGASASLAHGRLRRRLPGLAARPLARRALLVPPDLPLAEAVRRAAEDGVPDLVTVSADGRGLGVVSEAAVRATPEHRRPWVPVSSVARSVPPDERLPVDLAGEALVAAIARHPAGEYVLVAPDGTVAGVLRTVDVDRAFRAAAH
jgi:Zn-dependent protease